MSKYVVKVSSKATLREYTKLALDSKLYVDSDEYLLKSLYLRILDSEGYRAYSYSRDGVERYRPLYIVGICLVGDKAVGCAVLEGVALQVYVVEGYRRKGIATQIVGAMGKIYDMEHKVGMYGGSEIVAAYIAKKWGVVDFCVKGSTIHAKEGTAIPRIPVDSKVICV